jgi:selenocysteine lyase/cysteine desulfurase
MANCTAYPVMASSTATFALTLPGHHAADIAAHLAAQRIAASAGRFHAGSSFDALGLPEGRIGFLHHNTGKRSTLRSLRWPH